MATAFLLCMTLPSLSPSGQQKRLHLESPPTIAFSGHKIQPLSDGYDESC